MLRAMIDGRDDLQAQGEPDHVQLLRDILAANLRVPIDLGDKAVYEERSIGQLLRGERNGINPEYRDVLEAKGVSVVRPRRSRIEPGVSGTRDARLFLAHNTVSLQLLQDTRWAGTGIDQLLLRLPGARRDQQRCGGDQRPWGVSLPWPQCLDSLGRQDGEQDTENL